jgi:hypothetical protein
MMNSSNGSGGVDMPGALTKGLSRRQSISLEGDLSFYEDTALEKRAQLLEHPDLAG